jgi:hypothetical protein
VGAFSHCAGPVATPVLGGVLGGVEVAAGAGHAVRALLEEAVGAPAVAQVVVLPWLAVSCSAGGDGVTVKEDLDGADVAGEVAGVGVGPSFRSFSPLLVLE